MDLSVFQWRSDSIIYQLRSSLNFLTGWNTEILVHTTLERVMQYCNFYFKAECWVTPRWENFEWSFRLPPDVEGKANKSLLCRIVHYDVIRLCACLHLMHSRDCLSTAWSCWKSNQYYWTRPWRPAEYFTDKLRHVLSFQPIDFAAPLTPRSTLRRGGKVTVYLCGIIQRQAPQLSPVRA